MTLEVPLGNGNYHARTPNGTQIPQKFRKNMEDYRKLIVKGIKEAVPRVSNLKKALSGEQDKTESPAAWLTRLKTDMQLYSQLDLESEEGKTMLKVHFVLHSWPDIRRELEKLERWPERDLDNLLEEAQKVYVRRDEEKWKMKAKIMKSAEAEPKTPETKAEEPPPVPPRQPAAADRSKHFCTYCN